MNRGILAFCTRAAVLGATCLFVLTETAAIAQAPLTPEQRARLLQLAARRANVWQINLQRARELAQQLGIPFSGVTPDSTVFQLVGVNAEGMLMMYITDNLNAARTVSTDDVWPGGGAGLSLTGSGVVLHQWDGGKVRLTHQEFGGRVTQIDGATGLSGHSTHVAGTLIAAGVVAINEPNDTRGMSYQGTLKASDFTNDEPEMAVEAANGAVLSNHSYGFVTGWRYNGVWWEWWEDPSISPNEDRDFGKYIEQAAVWDTIAHDAPYYVICKSAGNDRGEGPTAGTVHQHISGGGFVFSSDTHPVDGGTTGYDCLPGGAACSKNVITVAAVEDIPAGYSGPGSVVMSSFSAWGPTDDGRIKPDISANGVGLWSSYSDADNQYANLSGTSMSTPNTTGSIGLLMQHQQNLHGSTKLRAATYKALVIHTADEAGPGNGPDYQFGWGLLNTRSAAQVMSDDASAGGDFHVREMTLNNGGTIEFNVQSDGLSPLAVTICWTDVPAGPAPAALDDPTAALINDLDLRVIDPSATSHAPWILDPANPGNAATTGDNFRDNVEKVYLASPAAGIYTVRITHKGTLHGGAPQDVSVIVTGNVPVTSSFVALKAYLQGPFDTGTGNSMSTAINSQLPLSQPYNTAPWNYSGTESVTSMPANVVDWVYLQARTGTASTTVAGERAAFITSDGSITDLDGTSAVEFSGLAAGNYYLAVFHRNHLAIMTAAPIALSGSPASYDFTTAQSQAFGTNPMAEPVTGVFAMRSGDGNSDGGVDALDLNTVWRPQNGQPWAYSTFGDFNLDGGIDALDKNLHWRPNNGSGTQVP